MNTFASELRELIQRYRDQPGMLLEELVDALDDATEELVDEINGRAD